MPARDAASHDDLDQLGFLLGRAYYSYITLLQARLDELGLGERLRPGMGSLLFALFREDDRSLATLAAELQLAKSTLTEMVGRMKQAGLVATAPDEADARAVRLRLTPLARSLRPRCVRLAAEMENLLGEELTAGERETLRRALKSVAATITSKLEAGGAASRRRRSAASDRAAKPAASKGESPRSSRSAQPRFRTRRRSDGATKNAARRPHRSHESAP